MIEFKYRPDVDGLRAVAVLLVMFCHADLGFPGGFVGVDVFFVISGFLITGLLLKEQQTDGFRLSHFWIRRIRRILPASIFVVVTTLIAGFFIMLPNDYDWLARSAIAQQAMLSNVYFLRNTGYFDGNTELMPLLHTWSLGVEEQFYIGYPFLVVLLYRYSRRLMAHALIVILIISLGMSEWTVHLMPSATFFLLPTRAWELLLGGVLCFAPTHLKASGWFANVLSCVGIAGIILAACQFDSTTRFPGASALLPCAGAAMVIYSNSLGTTWVGKLLASKPTVYVGLISYSLYLWHWPLLSLLRYLNYGAQLDTATRVASLASSFVLAALSLRYIESPFRNKQVFTQTKKLLAATVGAVLIVSACSLLIVLLRGLPQRFDPKAISYASAKNSESFRHEMSTKQVEEGDVPTFGNTESTPKYKCLVWGDSHAMALISGIDAACKDYEIQGLQATHSVMAPLLEFYVMEKSGLNERFAEFNRAVVEFVLSHKVDCVIMAGAWSYYARSEDFERCLHHTIKELVRSGVRVAIVRDVAHQKGNVPILLSMAVHLGRNENEIGVPQSEHLILNERCNRIIDGLKDQGVLILDPGLMLVDESGLWRAQLGGESMYRDDNHLSVEGSLRLKHLYERAFDYFGLK